MVGVTLGFLVALIFLVISIYACCTQKSSSISSSKAQDEIVSTHETSRPGSRLSLKSVGSGSVILVHKNNGEELIEVIEEVDEDVQSSVQDII